MTWEVLVSLIVAITGLIGSIWAIVKYYDTKRTKQQAQAKADEAAKAQAQDRELKEWIQGALEPIIAKNEEQHQDIRQLQEDVRILKEDVQFFKTDSVKMHEQLNQADEQINHNEMHRLQTAIIDFAMQLRNGVLMDRNSFNYICHTYDKYKSMGGNSFADSEMEYILDKKKEWESQHGETE